MNLIRCDKCKRELPIPKKKMRMFMLIFEIVDYQGYYVGNEGRYHLCVGCMNRYKKWLEED